MDVERLQLFLSLYLIQLLCGRDFFLHNIMFGPMGKDLVVFLFIYEGLNNKMFKLLKFHCKMPEKWEVYVKCPRSGRFM